MPASSTPFMSKSSVWEIELEDVAAAGLSTADAAEFYTALRRVCGAHKREDGSEAAEIWKQVVERRLLRPDHPHRLHQLVYYSVYATWDSSVRGPPPYWFSSKLRSKSSNLGRIMEVHGSKLLGKLYQDPVTSYRHFQKFSVQHPEIYWSIILKELSVTFLHPPKSILDTSDKSKIGGTWLPGAVLNIAECCLLPKDLPKRTDESAAIIWRDEGFDDSPVKYLSLKELREQVR